MFNSVNEQLVIQEFIYNSFVITTLGCFGIHTKKSLVVKINSYLKGFKQSELTNDRQYFYGNHISSSSDIYRRTSIIKW